MNNIIEYKSHIGSVEYSNKDKCFFGKLEMIDDLVTFEANTVEDLEQNFQDSVDEYVKTCQKLGKEMQKVYKGVFNVRISPKLHKLVYQRALKNNISLNALVGKSLEKYIRN
jgi:predicted HicB family RNase H-like nuclease